MDPKVLDDKNEITIAFGADDGEGGRIFQFRRDDKQIAGEAIKYGINKGIPPEEMDFLEVKL